MNLPPTIQRKQGINDMFTAVLRPNYGRKHTVIDEKFLRKALHVVENHLTDNEFSIEEFSREVGLSRAQLHRKLKSLTGKSASRYIMSLRLMLASEMIRNQEGNISEIAYSVGFSSPIYFTRCFKEEFGFPPSKLLVN